MKLISNQRGFAVVEVVLAVLLVAAIGAAGYFAYQAHRTTSSSPVAKTQPAASNPAPKQNWFKVPELGFQMQLPTDLNDLMYTAQTVNTPITDENNQDTGVTVLKVATFTTKSLAAADPGCSVDSQNGGGALAFGEYNADPTNAIMASGPSEVKKVGQYYLTIEDKQSSCAQSGSAQQQEDLLVHNLTAAFKTAKPL